MVFRDSLQFLPASLEQLAASLVKVNRGYFQNRHDVFTDVYPEADAELLKRKGGLSTTTSTPFVGSLNPHYNHDRPW